MQLACRPSHHDRACVESHRAACLKPCLVSPVIRRDVQGLLFSDHGHQITQRDGRQTKMAEERSPLDGQRTAVFMLDNVRMVALFFVCSLS